MPKNECSSIGKANLLLFLQFLSDFGDQITTALLALCVVDITNSTDKVGFIYFITTLAFIVFTLAGGYLGEKLHKRNILFYNEKAHGAAVLAAGSNTKHETWLKIFYRLGLVFLCMMLVHRFFASLRQLPLSAAEPKNQIYGMTRVFNRKVVFHFFAKPALKR